VLLVDIPTEPEPEKDYILGFQFFRKGEPGSGRTRALDVVIPADGDSGFELSPPLCLHRSSSDNQEGQHSNGRGYPY